MTATDTSMASLNQTAGQLEQLLQACAEAERAYQRAKHHRDRMRARLTGTMEQLAAKTLHLPGGGQVTRVAATTCRTVADQQLIAYVRANHPQQLATTVRPAWMKTLLAEGGHAVDPATGAVVPGVVAETGDPYLRFTLPEPTTP